MVGYVRHGRSMHRAARRDELTGLLNRRAAREGAETMLAHERGLAVILFDLDRFKHVNDSLGHHAGDQLLVVLGQRLAEVVREPEDVVARLGGDEFVVIARGVHDEEPSPYSASGSLGVVAPVRSTAWRSRSARASASRWPRSTARTTAPSCSAPTSRCTTPRAGAPDGRSTVTSSPCSDRAGLLMDADLRRAVTDGELTVHYQPIFAVEAAAYQGRGAGPLGAPPARPADARPFVPFAENTGAIKAVTAPSSTWS